MKNTMELRSAALKKLLANQTGIISDPIAIDRDTFEGADGRIYKVLSRDEADRQARELIRDTLWTLDLDVISTHAPKELSRADRLKLARARDYLKEDANELFESVIDDVDEFIDAAIAQDGRAAYLGTVDNRELNADEFLVYQVA